MSFEIEDNTPIPAPSRPRAGRGHKYPWPQMNPGQCIVLDTRKEYVLAQQSARNYRKSDPTFDYVSRACADGKFRVWRVLPKAEPSNTNQ